MSVGQEEAGTFVLGNKMNTHSLNIQILQFSFSKGSMRSELFRIVKDFVQRAQGRTQTDIC